MVLTVDAPFFGRRIPDLKNRFALPEHLKMANFVGLGNLEKGANKDQGGSGINNYVASLFDQSLSWKDVQWLKSITGLPIILKGIVRPDDARRAAEIGAAAVIVSNHGGRQLDDIPASIDLLPAVVEAVKGTRCEVYLDGGVREGTDVLKALALGAKMVFVGRPALWGLALAGDKGVKRVLELIRNELDRAMALSGCENVANIDKSVILVPKSSL